MYFIVLYLVYLFTGSQRPIEQTRTASLQLGADRSVHKPGVRGATDFRRRDGLQDLFGLRLGPGEQEVAAGHRLFLEDSGCVRQGRH